MRLGSQLSFVPEPTHKVCTKCKLVSPVGSFTPSSERKDGLSPWCHACVAAQAKVRWNDPERRERLRKTWRESYYRHADDAKRWRKSVSGKKSKKQYKLKSKYGMTLADFSAMLLAQGNACAVCSIAFIDSPKGGAHVDHCHATKRIRGLLCVRCNLTIGHAGDSVERLRALADYLEVTP